MSDTKRPAPKDIAILSGPTDDGQGARVLRIREGGDVSAGEIRPLREGESLNQSEVVRLHPLDGERRVCEVEVVHAPQGQGERQEAGARRSDEQPKRRARVSTDKYRKNWSAIFERSDTPAKRSDWSLN